MTKGKLYNIWCAKQIEILFSSLEIPLMTDGGDLVKMLTVPVRSDDGPLLTGMLIDETPERASFLFDDQMGWVHLDGLLEFTDATA